MGALPDSTRMNPRRTNPCRTNPSRTIASRMSSSRSTLYVGCYTAHSPVGIHRFDLRDGRLTERAHVTTFPNASYLAGPTATNVLYAVSETDAGALVALRADDRTVAGPVEIDRVPTYGDAPCHVSVHRDHVYVANYASGDVAAYALRPDGRFGPLVGRSRRDGAGPHARQDGPHAHCIVRRGSSVYAVDLGTDRIVRHVHDPRDGRLRPVDETELPAGSGPRHLVFHPTAPTAFVACELDCTVVTLDVDIRTGRLTVRSSVSTLPPGPVGASTAAAVIVHPDGERLIVSNRGDDSIATFAIDRAAAGRLRLLGHVASGGRTPRDLAVDPSGRLLLAANQESGTITAFELDGRGLPRPRGVVAEVSQPVCLVVGEAR